MCKYKICVLDTRQYQLSLHIVPSLMQLQASIAVEVFANPAKNQARDALVQQVNKQYVFLQNKSIYDTSEVKNNRSPTKKTHYINQ